MKSKPKLFNVLCVFNIAVLLSIPIQILGLYEYQTVNSYILVDIFHKITPLNWIVMGLCLVNAFFCLNAHSFLKYTIPTSIALVIINNFIVGSWGNDFSFGMTLSASLGYAIASLPYRFGNVSLALDEPDKRWWRVPKRILKSYPVWIQHGNQKRLLAKTYDISSTGAFISSLTNNPNLFPTGITIGDSIGLIIATQEGEVNLKAIVRRKEDIPKGHYPCGLGVQFESQDFKSMLFLRRGIYSAT